MNNRACSLVWFGLVGAWACSGGAGRIDAQAATATPAPRIRAPEPVSNARTTPIEYHDPSDSDRVFIENAERAIGQYTEFIARAGESAEYAQAVRRSREQIEDLRAAIVFVRAGSD
jgi:hypothetical protein